MYKFKLKNKKNEKVITQYKHFNLYFFRSVITAY